MLFRSPVRTNHFVMRFSGVVVFVCAFALVSNAQGPKKSVTVRTYPRLIRDGSATPRGRADGLFQRQFNMQAGDRLQPLRSWDDELGYAHDSYQQYYRNVKVEGAVFTVHSRNGLIESLSGEFKGISGLEVTPAIPAMQALQLARDHVGASLYAWDDRVRAGYPGYEKPRGELVIIGGSEGDTSAQIGRAHV